MLCSLILWVSLGLLVSRLVLSADQSHLCERIGCDYQDLLLNDYLKEVLQAKKKYNVETSKEELLNMSMEENFLRHELLEFRDAIMNTTLKSKFFYTTLDRTGSNVLATSKINIQQEVERHYNSLKNLKVALWRQEPFLSPTNMKDMKHLGDRMDVAFFLLLMRCLLPPLHR